MEHRIFFPLGEDGTGFSVLAAKDYGSPEQRDDDYIVLADPALGLKWRDSAKGRNKLELKFRTRAAAGVEVWRKLKIKVEKKEDVKAALARVARETQKTDAGPFVAKAAKLLADKAAPTLRVKKRRTKCGEFEQTDVEVSDPARPSGKLRYRTVCFEGNFDQQNAALVFQRIAAAHPGTTLVGGYPQWLASALSVLSAESAVESAERKTAAPSPLASKAGEPSAAGALHVALPKGGSL